MQKTSIEWTDFTWNPVTGCNKVSQGCKNCYAETIANRFWGERKFTDVIMHVDRLHEPAKNKKKWAGKKVFVCSMSDLFHESVSFDFIDKVFAQFVNFPDTNFQILTKRPDRALEYYKHTESEYSRIAHYACEGSSGFTFLRFEWPLENVWIGVSCEDQATADLRIPLLLQIPAAVRFLSCEPLLGPINIEQWVSPCSYYCDHSKESYQQWASSGLPGTEDVIEHALFSQNNHHPHSSKIDWVIVGGESGHGARPMHQQWVRSLLDQCNSNVQGNVPFFFKQWGEWLPSLNGEGPGVRLGKSKSGHLLDGKEHRAFPIVNCQL